MAEDNHHKHFRDSVINKISPSFCAAKWLNATIWLNSGMTASCHHPTPHFAGIDYVQKNPTGIHNTELKKQARAEMLSGKRPAECEYCWKIEDLSKDHISDRVFKSEIYSKEDIERIAKLDPNENVNLRTLEIAFDRVCNFACSYCSPHFSTVWAKDIKTNGPYQALPTDTANHYTHDAAHADAFKDKENPFIEAFWQWWPELKLSLHQLRITGGEPLLSPHVWKILEQLNLKETPDLKLAINSNLGSSPEIIKKLIDLSKTVPHLEVYTSNESFGNHAEYIRDGLKWSLWLDNCKNLIFNSNIKSFHIMMTVNGLCLFSITEFLDQIVEWKKTAPIPVIFSVNILRFPEFQSPAALPLSFKHAAKEKLQLWKRENFNNILDFEIAGIERLITYLSDVEYGSARAAEPELLQKDLKRFLIQYDHRRKKDFSKTFPKDFVQWINQLEIQHV